MVPKDASNLRPATVRLHVRWGATNSQAGSDHVMTTQAYISEEMCVNIE